MSSENGKIASYVLIFLDLIARPLRRSVLFRTLIKDTCRPCKTDLAPVIRTS